MPVPAVPSSTAPTAPRPGGPTTTPQRWRRTQLALSAGTAALGVAMLLGLLGNPMTTTEALGGLVGRLGAGQLGALLVALALLGLPAALGAPVRVVRVTGTVQLVGHLLAVSTSHVVVLLGYLLAAAVPLGALTVGVLACRRYPVARWLVLLGATAAGVWGWLTGVLAVGNVTQTFGRVAVALAARAGEQVVLLWLTAGVLVAGTVLLHALAAHPARPRWEGWLLRHRRVLTLVAAAGPLPYVLLRMTWLTPWPVGAPDGLDVSTRLWGLLLGSAGLTGTVLTLGLIRPWGSVAPRWLPGVAGRRVPVAAAAVPAAVVATALLVAAVPMLVATLTDLGTTRPAELVLFLVTFPFGIWGPALALATWAYVLHRRADDVHRSAAAG